MEARHDAGASLATQRRPKSPHGTFTDMFGDSHEVKDTDTVNPKETAKEKDKP